MTHVCLFVLLSTNKNTRIKKSKKYFETIGFSGEILYKVLHGLSLKANAKNDFFVEEGKTSKHIGLLKAARFYTLC